MTDQSPQVVAAASLSPVSPRPLHTTYSLPQVLPDLQQQAENPDVVPLEQTTYRTAEAAMAEPVTASATEQPAQPDAPEGSASSSELASIADDDSFQYDGEGDGDNGQAEAQDVSGQETQQEAGDDYAMTFDSPSEQEQQDGRDGNQEQQEQQEQQQPQQVVSEAPESISIPEQHVQPDPVDPQAPSPSEKGSSSDQAISTDSSSQSSEDGSATVPAAVPVQDAALPDGAATAATTVQPEQTEASDAVQETAPREIADVQPKPEDVEMITGDAPDATPLDIQKLVDEITAKSEATEQAPEQQGTQAPSLQTPSAPTADVDFSLPAKPALTQEQSKQTFSPATYHHPSLPDAPNFSTSKSISLPAPPSQPAFANTVPGIQSQSIAQTQSYQAPVPTFPSFPNAFPPGNTSQQAPAFQNSGNGPQQTYDDFLADERKAMAEAKWERFPDGSRIFIGNLSQERVSKRDVYELFHPHGRLAQISLKSAYGFVQYHTTAEAQSAMNGLQGAEVKGRKINLEISRTQKTKKDREHTPPERRNRGDRGERGERGGRNGDRYDGGRRRDNDFRGPRSASPRRDDSHRGRQEPYNRDRGQHNGSNRKRSRSPENQRRTDSYRRRSPSPYGRGRQEQPPSDQLGIPRRYGSDVPDVQILMMQDVHKDFVDWVQRAFHDQGLRPDAMFLNPRFPREAVIQRQVLEGVHGVVELDMRAQNTAKISLQVFDRSAGTNVRFDQYQELDPPVAAQLVLRTKGSAVAQQQQQQAPAYPTYPPQPYGAPNPYGGYGQPSMQQQPQPQATSDISALVTQLSHMPNIDAATMQTILASIQQQQQPQPPAPVPHTPVNAYPSYNQGSAGQVDLNALINNLSAASANNGPAAMRTGGGMAAGGYAPQPGGFQQQPQQQQGLPQPQIVAGSSDPARDVQDIIATFARYRQ